MFKSKVVKIVVGLCLISVPLGIASLATASGGPTGPSPSYPNGTATYGLPGPTSTGGTTTNTPWACSVYADDPTYHSGIGTYGGVLFFGHQTCTGIGYAPQRVATSIWDYANYEIVAGWNYSAWTSASYQTKNSELLCTSTPGYHSFEGLAEGEAQNGAEYGFVQSLDDPIFNCGY